MTEQAAAYTISTTHGNFEQTASAIIAATEREYWERKNRELVRLSNVLCEVFNFSRGGYIKGKQVSVKELRCMTGGKKDEQ